MTARIRPAPGGAFLRILRVALPLAAALLVAWPATIHGQASGGTECASCHGELELLRQHVPTLSRARELLVTPADLAGTAHGDMACAECHTGFARFPHPQAGTRTAGCASCHEKADTAWLAGVHSREDADWNPAASCAGCHGVHSVATAEALADREGAAMPRMNEACVDCHQAEALPASDPHAGTVGCWTCHEAHPVLPTDEPGAAIAPARQAATCGACHDSTRVAWAEDAHGQAAARALTSGAADRILPADEETPVCTACHGGHGMAAVEDRAFALEEVDRCAACHADAARSFVRSYHGKATALGSTAAAACSDCHGAHGVFAADDARSMVHEASLVETCADCHEHARPAFVKYDSHPNPWDPDRNPWIFGAFWFMNALLGGTLLVFGTHTVLWWVRIARERREGHGHGGHGHPEPREGGEE